MATLRMSLAQSTGKPGRRVVSSQWLVANPAKILMNTGHW